MQRSTQRGDHKCIVFLGVVSVLFVLFSINLVSAESYVQRVYGTCYTGETTYGGWRTIDFDYASLDGLVYDNTANFQDYYLDMWNGNIPQGGRIKWSEDGGGGINMDCSEGCEKNSEPRGDGIYDGYWGFQHFGCLTEDCNVQNNIFRDAMKYQTTAKCVGNKVTYNYTGQFYSGPYSGDEGTEIGCNANMLYIELWNSTPPSEYNCSKPIIANLTISPEYDSEKYTNRTNLTYEEIFPDNKLKPYINLTIKYSDGSEPDDDEEFTVVYIVNFTYPFAHSFIHGGLSLELPEIPVTCHRNCKIEIPEDFGGIPTLDQDTNIGVRAYIFENGVRGENKTTSRYTPYFDVILGHLDSGNVIFGEEELVQNKPIATRVEIIINSYIRKNSTYVVYDYIDSIKDMNVSFIFDGKREMNIVEDIMRYESEESLKQKVINGSLSNDERIEAMNILKDIYKKAKDTVNFIGYIPKGKSAGSYLVEAEIEAGDINDYHKSNNDFTRMYNLRAQKDSDFKFMFKGVESGVFSIKDYEGERQRMMGAYDFFKSAFPFDPTKVSAKISKEPTREWIPATTFPSSPGQIVLKNIQKEADKNGYDMIFAVIPESLENNPEQHGFVMLIYNKAAAVKEGYDFAVYSHEAGHLFGLYDGDSEQLAGPPCLEEEDIGLLSSDGWCMNSETGEPCNISAFTDHVHLSDTGEIITIWPDRTRASRGCYGGSDGPYGYESLGFQPNTVGTRKLDIMGKSTDAWPRADPTYGQLKKEILI